MKKALKMALEALEGMQNAIYNITGEHVIDLNYAVKKADVAEQTITAIKKSLAQPEQDNTYIYASSLATAIWQKHYMKESPKFALLDTTEGVLTQIDNMTCGLVREKPAQQEQEPVAWFRKLFSPEIGEFFDYKDGAFAREADSKGWTPLYITPPQRKPLPFEQVDLLWHNTCTDDFILDIREFAQAIESAHGIKGD